MYVPVCDNQPCVPLFKSIGNFEKLAIEELAKALAAKAEELDKLLSESQAPRSMDHNPECLQLELEQRHGLLHRTA